MLLNVSISCAQMLSHHILVIRIFSDIVALIFVCHLPDIQRQCSKVCVYFQSAATLRKTQSAEDLCSCVLYSNQNWKNMLVSNLGPTISCRFTVFDEGIGILSHRRLDLFHFLEAVLPIIQEAPSVHSRTEEASWMRGETSRKWNKSSHLCCNPYTYHDLDDWEPSSSWDRGFIVVLVSLEL